MKDKDKCKLHAEIFAAGSDEPAFLLTGSWLSHIDVQKKDIDSGEWGPPTRVYQQYIVNGDDDTTWDEIYRMNDIALTLNQVDDELLEQLPPTDSRFRPDMKAMEEGDSELCLSEKY